MNFYEFYQLINENTVSQELKKFAQKEYSKDFIDKVVRKIISMIHDALSARFNLNTKTIIAKWVAYIAIKKKDDNYNTAFPIQANYHASITRIENLMRIGVTFLHTVSDYLVASTDENGDLNPQLASKFNNPSFSPRDLKELSDQYHEDLKNKQRNKPGRVGKTVLAFPDGYSWVDLERRYCELERDTMGHCGNVGGALDDTILSLRDKKNIPYLTFILNKGILGEMKGRGNDKPSTKYHPYIIELLKLPIIKRIKGEGYLPEKNFKLSDLKEDQLEELIKIKPNFENDFLFEKMMKTPRSPESELTKEEILKLSEDETTHVKIKLIGYISPRGWHYGDLKYQILEKLSDDKNHLVRYQVAILTNNSDILDKLSNDENLDVKRVVAGNIHTKTETLDKLVDEKKDNKLYVPATMYRGIAENIAENPNTSISTLNKLSTHKEPVVRRSVVNNKNTPLETIEKMMGDENANVSIPAMWTVAGHPKASSQSLDKIVDKVLSSRAPESELVKIISRNPNLSKEALEKIEKI